MTTRISAHFIAYDLDRTKFHTDFPLCFSDNGNLKRPLAVGIRDELFKAYPDRSTSDLTWFLRHYVNGWRYLRTLKLGVGRVNMDGTVAGLVSQAEADHARNLLSKRHARKIKREKIEEANHV